MIRNLNTMKKFVFIIAIILFVGGFVVYKISGGEKTQTAQAYVEVDKYSIDLGRVSMADGVAKTTFNLKNSGDQELEINALQTSCMCTTVKLIIDGNESPIFGMHANPAWKTNLAAGASAVLEVMFDPNAHGPEATGPFERLILVGSNAGNEGELQLKIIGTVVK